MPRRLLSLIIAALMLVTLGLALAWPGEGLQPGQACQASAQPAVCPCQAQGPESGAACACGGDAPCQVSSAPAGPHLETLTGQAWQPEPLPLAQAEEQAAFPGWARLARAGGESPWRPPKPLYLRHSSLLI